MIACLLNQILLPLLAKDGYYMLKTEASEALEGKKQIGINCLSEKFDAEVPSSPSSLEEIFIEIFQTVVQFQCCFFNLAKVLRETNQIPPPDSTTGLNPASGLRRTGVGDPPCYQDRTCFGGPRILTRPPCQRSVQALQHQQLPIAFQP